MDSSNSQATTEASARSVSPRREGSRVVDGILLPTALMLAICFLYTFSNPSPSGHFDYTFRIAGAFLEGKLGLSEPVSWLNELVPFEGSYYSVFPLGAVLSMLPVALIQKLLGNEGFPAAMVTGWVAGVITYFLWMLAGQYALRLERRLLLTLLPLIGTWFWCNMCYGGAWQLALELAVLGQCGALYFTLAQRQPVLAGFFFAIGFGNRTEVLLTAPLYLYLLARPDPTTASSAYSPFTGAFWREQVLPNIRDLLAFCLFPLLLGVATLWYNAVRFHSITDFGYSRIPGILEEPWYGYGFFSNRYIPQNLKAMLFDSSWKAFPEYPFLIPEPFGGSILSACPFLMLLFREGGRDKGLRVVSWIGIAVLTYVLWIHGNVGGWQYSYRYASVFLPWLFILWRDYPAEGVSGREVFFFALSVALSGWATYQFFWTDGYKF